MKNLLIDIGSTSIKWYVNENKRGQFPFPKQKNKPLPFFEVKPNKIIKPIKHLIKKIRPNRLFISTQMHGYILLDKRGRPVSNYVSWQDKRASLVDIPFSILPESGSAKKDNLPKSSVYATKLLFPKIIKKAQEFCTLGSFITKRLCGYNVTHITDGAASGFFNVLTLEGQSELKLPEVKKDVICVGKYKNTQLFTPIGDQQSAVLGSKATTGEYIMNIGTAGQLCVICNGFITGKFESRPFFDGKTLCTVTNLLGGKQIQNLGNNWIEAFERVYDNAFEVLPKCNSIVVSGGYGKKYKAEITSYLEKKGLRYRFSDNEEAIGGLIRISKTNIYGELK